MKNIQYITAFFIGLAACTPSNNNFAINERSMVDRETVIENSIVLSNNEKYSEALGQYAGLLRSDLSNSFLQSLNAINYHRMALDGKTENYDLAAEGYRISSDFDPDAWQPHFLKGLIEYQTSDYVSARNSLLKAAVRNPKSSEILYSYAASAYASLEFDLSLAILKKVKALDKNFCDIKQCSGTLAIVAAAAGSHVEAERYLKEFEAINSNNSDLLRIENKTNLWKAVNKFNLDVPNLDEIVAEDEIELDEQMVEVDVIILGSQRDLRTSSGVNLLDGLVLQFGDIQNDLPIASYSRETSKDLDDSDNNEDLVSVIRAITLPGIQYSLNIFNESGNYNQVIAKPSLLALHKETSTFFSGVEINAASTSGSGEAVEVSEEVGVMLEIKPQFQKNGKILLEIEAERTFLTDPDTSVIFDYRLDTSKTNISASAILEFGQTLILGGMTDQENQKNGQGVPILDETPILKNIFSNRNSRDYEKSVTILLTPRRARISSSNSSTIDISNTGSNNRDLKILLSMLNIRNENLYVGRTYSYQEFLAQQKYIGKNDFNVGNDKILLSKIEAELRESHSND